MKSEKKIGKGGKGKRAEENGKWVNEKEKRVKGKGGKGKKDVGYDIRDEASLLFKYNNFTKLKTFNLSLVRFWIRVRTLPECSIEIRLYCTEIVTYWKFYFPNFSSIKIC